MVIKKQLNVKKQLALVLIIYYFNNIQAQTYPVFGNEKPVNIIGLTFDAMEPAFSSDGNALFFNSLNDGITTSLYYASKINDSTFNYIGLVPVVNQTITPRLDGVPSIDSSNNFYWISLRNYPAQLENLYRIQFLTTGFSNYGKVFGNFYINAPGYLIMDATINNNGSELIYCNAYFNNCVGLPCKASLGMASKINDSTFIKTVNHSQLLANVNDTSNYIVYAPHITKDGLELYYTRLLKNSTQSEIVVSVRTATNNTFGLPQILVSTPYIAPEAATTTADKSKMYYHRKEGTMYKLFYQERLNPSFLKDNSHEMISIYPNPTSKDI